MKTCKTRFSNLRTLSRRAVSGRTDPTTIVIKTTSSPRKCAIQRPSTQSYSTSAVVRTHYPRRSRNTRTLGHISALVVVTKTSRLETTKTGFDRSREKHVGYTLRGQTIYKSLGFNASYMYINTTLRRSSTIITGRSGRPWLTGCLSRYDRHSIIGKDLQTFSSI